MSKRRARLMLGMLATTVALTIAPMSAPANAMTCSPDFEAVCVVIGTSCRILDTVEAKVIKKDLINCQLG